jgi:4-carboxymuconolactone decarboxylase
MGTGEKIRREVMGDAFVDKALAGANEFTQPMQDLINDACWGTVWARDGLDRRTRSLVTIGMLAALKAPQELKGHVRGALNNGATVDEIREVLLHSIAYCGAPACQEAFRAAREVIDEL